MGWPAHYTRITNGPANSRRRGEVRSTKAAGAAIDAVPSRVIEDVRPRSRVGSLKHTGYGLEVDLTTPASRVMAGVLPGTSTQTIVESVRHHAGHRTTE